MISCSSVFADGDSLIVWLASLGAAEKHVFWGVWSHERKQPLIFPIQQRERVERSSNYSKVDCLS